MVSTFDKIVESSSKDVLALLAVFMSSFIAAFSVYEASKRYDVRSENFLRSARLLQTLRERVSIDMLAAELTWDKVKIFEKEYTNILDSYSDNHGAIDFLVFRANIGKLDRCTRWKTKFVSVFTVWWLFTFSVLSPAIVFALYFVTANIAPAVLPHKRLPVPPAASSNETHQPSQHK